MFGLAAGAALMLGHIQPAASPAQWGGCMWPVEVDISISRVQSNEYLEPVGPKPAPGRDDGSLHRWRSPTNDHTRTQYRSALYVKYVIAVTSNFAIVGSQPSVSIRPAPNPDAAKKQDYYVPPASSQFVKWQAKRVAALDRTDDDPGDVLPTRETYTIEADYFGSGWYSISFLVRTTCSPALYRGDADGNGGRLMEHICVPAQKGADVPEPPGSWPCRGA